MFFLLLFTTFHNHGSCCCLPFTPSFLSFPFKGYRRVKEMQGTFCKATSRLCRVKSKSQMVEKASRGSKKSNGYADTCSHSNSFYLWIFYWQQERGHFSKCSVRSKSLGRVRMANAETACLATGKRLVYVFCGCLSISS